ncbi:hypothetical protein TthWC1_1555 [Thermoanaerobacter thermohydrosulfuricus WC1]|uniref:Uncharacterized protein n=2 Tax=Thermoanaerobacter TaxID=1754 RepID=D3T343_THEIA|nr:MULTISPECIES: hypothetical protein [Thermoanaerobacter]ADD02645.1 hypothetical protein Thit_1386 [Thermoanaerobacter italicus Ab9]EMT38847.1 hypothetical protein TthWC1_1555 [Thermoanaerobacter thermohydrosulfuricus WC1]
MRCIDCKWYPWVLESDPTMLPAHRCHPSLPFKRWTPYSVKQDWECPFFEPIEGLKVTATEEKEAKKTTKKTSSKKKKGGGDK